MQNLLFDELCIKRLKKSFLIFAIACVGFISARLFVACQQRAVARLTAFVFVDRVDGALG